jgi:hypothetical protein
MDVLIQHTYRTSKKEPFGVLLRRLHDGLVAASLPVAYEFVFGDAPVGGGVSAVDRAVKKFPQIAALVPTAEVPGIAGAALKMIAGHDTDLPFATLAEIADGLPRSLPFHAARVHFTGSAFGAGSPVMATGITASDRWWVNGRERGLSASLVLDVAASSRTLPPPEGALAGFLASLGKPAKTNRLPMIQPAQPEETAKSRAALVEITQKYRARLGDLVAESAMPHSLPARIQALKMGRSGEQNPLKPALERYFKPLGFSCKGGSGTFSLRRRTASNHVVEIDLDVGPGATW